MVPSGLLTPSRRDAVLVLIALVMLTAPVWVPTLHIDDPTYRYESVTIKTNGSDMAFTSAPTVDDIGISDRIVCASGGMVSRSCYIERFIAANNTIPTGIYSATGTLADRPGVGERYDYVLVNGTVYETVFVPNRSAPQKKGAVRLDAGLRPVEAERVLRFVSVPIEDVSSPVRKAARTGVAYGHQATVPDTPVQRTDDTYRRVYIANTTYPPDFYQGTESLLMIGGPILGLVVLAWLRTRIDITLTVTDAR